MIALEDLDFDVVLLQSLCKEQAAGSSSNDAGPVDDGLRQRFRRADCGDRNPDAVK
jgi:hypothetical protein